MAKTPAAPKGMFVTFSTSFTKRVRSFTQNGLWVKDELFCFYTDHPQVGKHDFWCIQYP